MLLSSLMRALALALLLALAACKIQQADVYAGDDAVAPLECVTATDCVLAASTCCACPDFAMPDMGWGNGCEDIACPMPADCPAIQTACESGVCTTACAPITCQETFPGGFAVDAAGCLECAPGADSSPPPTCLADSDCVEIAADCCGCAHGGMDTAVPADQAQAAMDALMCPNAPACPEVDVCDAAAVPRCVAGGCALVGAPPDGLTAQCGRPDLPMCPEGTVCVLNADPQASSQGAGTCQPG